MTDETNDISYSSLLFYSCLFVQVINGGAHTIHPTMTSSRKNNIDPLTDWCCTMRFAVADLM